MKTKHLVVGLILSGLVLWSQCLLTVIQMDRHPLDAERTFVR
jgi:hypothetical protein